MRNWITLVEQLQDITIRIDGNMIIASLDGRDVAWYSIDKREEGRVSLHANVDAAARRQGISTKVYDWAQPYFASKGLKLVPFARLSPEAHQMWQKRDPDAVAGYTQDGDNFYR